MKYIRALVWFLVALTTASNARAVNAYFTSVPSSANGGESYYVAAAAYGSYGADISLYKSGNFLGGVCKMEGWKEPEGMDGFVSRT